MRLSPHHDSRLVDHALAILREMVERDGPRSLTRCEMLACRILAPIAGEKPLAVLCEEFCKPRRPWSVGHLKMRLEHIEETVRVAMERG